MTTTYVEWVNQSADDERKLKNQDWHTFDTVTLTRSHEQIAFKHETKVTHVLDGLDEGRSRERSKC